MTNCWVRIMLPQVRVALSVKLEMILLLKDSHIKKLCRLILLRLPLLTSLAYLRFLTGWQLLLKFCLQLHMWGNFLLPNRIIQPGTLSVSERMLWRTFVWMNKEVKYHSKSRLLPGSRSSKLISGYYILRLVGN